MISFYDKRGGEKKKCKCLPPTQCEINQNQSPGRKDGRKEGSGRALSPEASALPRQPSIIAHLRTNTPAKHTLGRTHKGVQKRKTYAQDCVKRSDSNPSKVTPCNVFTIMRRITLNAMDASAGAPGRAFLMLFSKYKRQYELW